MVLLKRKFFNKSKKLYFAVIMPSRATNKYFGSLSYVVFKESM